MYAKIGVVICKKVFEKFIIYANRCFMQSIQSWQIFFKKQIGRVILVISFLVIDQPT